MHAKTPCRVWLLALEASLSNHKSRFFLGSFVITFYSWESLAGADLGGGCRGCAPPPEMKLSSSYSLLKFVYLTGQWRHFLEVHPLLSKILNPPLSCRILLGLFSSQNVSKLDLILNAFSLNSAKIQTEKKFKNSWLQSTDEITQIHFCFKTWVPSPNKIYI